MPKPEIPTLAITLLQLLQSEDTYDTESTWDTDSLLSEHMYVLKEVRE